MWVLLILFANSAYSRLIHPTDITTNYQKCISTIANEYLNDKTTVVVDPLMDIDTSGMKYFEYPKIEFYLHHTLTSVKSRVNNYILTYHNLQLLNDTLSQLKSKIWSWNSRGNYLITSTIVINSEEIKKILKLLWNYNIYNLLIATYDGSNGMDFFSYDFLKSKCGHDIIAEHRAICKNGLITAMDELYEEKISNDYCNNTLLVLWGPTKPFAIDFQLKVNPGILISAVNLIGEKSNMNIKYAENISRYLHEIENVHDHSNVADDFNNNYGDIFVSLAGYDDTKCLIMYDCTVPLFHEHVLWILPKPQKKPFWKSIVAPFTLSTWMLLCVTVFFSILMFWLMSHQQNEVEKFRSFIRSLIVAFRIMLAESDNLIPKTFSFRLFFVIFSIACVIINTYYQGKLFSFLSNPGYEKAILTLDDILNSGLPMMFRQGFGNLFIFNGPKSDQVYDNFIPLNYSNDDALYYAVRQKDFLTITNQGQIILYPHLKSSFNTLEIYFFHITTYVKRDHFLLNRLNIVLQRIQEGGFYNKWISDIELAYFKQPIDDDIKGAFKLTVNHLEGALVIFGVGYSLAIIAFIFELISVRIHFLYGKRFRDKILLFLQRYDRLKQKNDSKSIEFRKRGNELYSKYNNEQSLKNYNKSLRHATYNSEAYALTLANRSEVFFAMQDYQSCINDINLCLQAKYPDDLKPKILIFIRKANCFKKLGKLREMRTTLVDVLMFIDETPTLLDAVKKKYRKQVRDMIMMEVCVSNDPQNKFLELPSIDPSPTFLNASTSVVLQYNKRSGFHVKAKNDISQGEVIFVEKAYAFCSDYKNGKMCVKSYCQYCTSQTTGCIPCKSCVKYIYCSEKCRDSAWAEFHQWECFGIQSGLLPQFYIGNLALRTVLKASHTGISADTIDFNDGTINSYGNENDNYPYVYNLPNVFGKLPKEKLMNYAATAALIVHYLKLKTDFLDYLKTKPAYTNKKDKELMNKLGGIMLRHITQFQWNAVTVKAVNIHSNEPNDVFLTICPSIALMAHSCNPNTSYFFIGDTVVVKAMKNIKSNEELVRSYMNLTYRQMGNEIRQRRLLETLFINCRCDACTNTKMDRDLWDSYVCPKCKGSAKCEKLVTISSLPTCVCLDCNYKFIFSENIINLELLSAKLLLKFELQGNIGDVIHSLKISKTIFHPKHLIFHNNLYPTLLKHYLNKGDLKNYIEIGAESNNQYKLMYTEVALEYGMFQYQYCLNLMKLVESSAINVGLSHLRDALKTLTVSVNESKTVFSLHYPQFLVYLQEVEEKISKIRILHAIPIANEASLNI